MTERNDWGSSIHSTVNRKISEQITLPVLVKALLGKNLPKPSRGLQGGGLTLSIAHNTWLPEGRGYSTSH